MDLLIYNRANTKADTFNEGVYLSVAMMYASQVSYSSFISENMLMWHCRDTWGDKFYCMMHETIYGGDEEPGQGLRLYKSLQKVRNTKHKNKEMIVAHQRIESKMRTIKQDVVRYFTTFMEKNKLLAPLQFWQEEIRKKEASGIKDGMQEGVLMIVNATEYNEDATVEDPLIKEIVDSFLENNGLVVLDEVIETLVPFKRVDNNEQPVSEPYFISSYLFEFPLMFDLNYEQLKNVRDDLKPTIEPFHQEYKKLIEELAAIPYNNSEQQIRMLLNTHINPHIQNIQKKIDENIYIQQQKNRYGAEERIKVMLGITSVENQIRLLEKEEVILPFVADVVIEKLGKNFDIKSCMPFIYHKLPKPNN